MQILRIAFPPDCLANTSFMGILTAVSVRRMNRALRPALRVCGCPQSKANGGNSTDSCAKLHGLSFRCSAAFHANGGAPMLRRGRLTEPLFCCSNLIRGQPIPHSTKAPFRTAPFFARNSARSTDPVKQLHAPPLVAVANVVTSAVTLKADISLPSSYRSKRGISTEVTVPAAFSYWLLLHRLVLGKTMVPAGPAKAALRSWTKEWSFAALHNECRGFAGRRAQTA
jgi:hypothetical protein